MIGHRNVWKPKRVAVEQHGNIGIVLASLGVTNEDSCHAYERPSEAARYQRHLVRGAEGSMGVIANIADESSNCVD